MDQKNMIDISSFLLFEATGDSESDATNIHQAKFNMAEDDAMSCSYDSSYDTCVNEYDGDQVSDRSANYVNGHLGARNSHYGLSYVDTRSDDEDEGVVNQVWRGDKLEQDKKNMAEQQQQQQKKKNVCVEKTMKLISQREQDRLFWEACLAS